MMTPWGYETESLPPLLDAGSFHEMTGNKYINNPRAAAALQAASQAIRNYCGWHISPEIECTAHLTGEGNILRLPASYVSKIFEITEENELVTEYEWKRDGLLRKTMGKHWSDSWDSVEVRYVAGYNMAAVPDLVEAVRSITEGVITVSAGVTSESADGVAIAYSVSASSIAAGLTNAQKGALSAYKVVNSHAA